MTDETKLRREHPSHYSGPLYPMNPLEISAEDAVHAAV